MAREGGSVFLLALVLFLALQLPASAEKKAKLLLLFLFSIQFLSDHLQELPGIPVGSGFSSLERFPDTVEFQPINGIAHIFGKPELTGVLAVIQDRVAKLHTTHSWDFLGLRSNGRPTDAWSSARFGEDTIIGSIDTGVWPESQSFQDNTYAAIPSRWRGTCDAGNDPTFRCNRKLIGARFFSKGIQLLGMLEKGEGPPPSKEDLSSPRDYVGHGAHTLSTAGGAPVPGAGVFGHGTGNAVGGSPGARVAAYKACFEAGCSSFDVLAATIAAVADGVDVLSMSLGTDSPGDYLMDPIAIGAFFAVQMGVTVVCSAGNSGPGPSTVSNVAPWMFTVGASTMDREFPAYVTFGGSTIKGQSLADSTLPIGTPHPMISGENANAANIPTANSSLCLPGSLDHDKVKDKIVICVRGENARVEKGLVVKEAGGVGMVLCNDASTGDQVFTDSHLVAAAHCSYSQCVHLFSYLKSTDDPSGYITATDAKLDVKPAPEMADFWSRGPNSVTPQILKPDITAPGVTVIAAYSGAVSQSGLPFDDRRVPYNIMSGTSMSCPHVSGIVGLLRTKYPWWTPAMFKSAIMTTASTEANDGNPIRDETGAAATPFSYGSGHVDPVKALDPGLVYDATPVDYVNFLCSLKLTQDPLPSLPVPVDVPALLESLTLPLFKAAGNPLTCSHGSSFRPEDLNYPSITVPCLPLGSTTVKRRVKNVGAKASSYTVKVVEPTGVHVTVLPPKLSFGNVGEEKEFAVKLEVYDTAAAADYVFGSIEWSDGTHRVRSPIVAKARCG
ncbi:hypothetical protein PR202_ga09982 [Eleusine coracana subsp. coracana]|uniref:Subtilisin-like protease SBT5.3 n=1 Tax=Eleusine coracana subsp. coracana TaxID=191504 RepID=A0AAV5C4Z8_ELECO|nr:hypothetical protein PR202_ga09982 [Eleusine coracana subsp. coracana]